MITIPFFRQGTDYTCGAASARMVLAYVGIRHSEDSLATEMDAKPATGIARAALVRGLRRAGMRCSPTNRGTRRLAIDHVAEGRPVIVNFREPSAEEGHYAVLVDWEKGTVTLQDPRNGPGFRLSEGMFLRRWLGHHAPSKSVGWLCACELRTKQTHGE